MFSSIKCRAGGLLMASVAILICGLPMTAGTAATVAMVCALTKMKVVIADGTVNSTSSGSFQTIRGTNFAFVQGGTRPGCVTIELQAQAYAPSTGNGLVSLNNVLDSVQGACLPSQPQFSANNGIWSVVNTITFYCQNVAPGTHRIALQFRSANGGMVEVNNPITVVRYQ